MSWRIEPFLHVSATACYNPLTDRALPADDGSTVRSVIDRRLSLADAPAAVRERMIADGWLVDDADAGATRFNLQYVSLEAGTSCNQGCYFCPVSTDPRPAYQMPMPMYERIVGELAAYRKTVRAVFMNGYNEPTADPRFLDQVRCLKSHGLPPAVLTNATGLTPARVDALVAMGGLAFLSVNLSTLDRARYAADRQADHLDLVLRHLEYVKDRAVASRMDLVVLGRGDATHDADAAAIRRHFAGSRFDVKPFAVMDRAGRLPLGLRPPQPHESLAGCDNVGSRPLQHLHITPKGTCLLCCEDYDEQHPVGDLTRESVDDVLSGQALARYRRQIYGLDDAPAEFMCRHCVFALTRPATT